MGITYKKWDMIPLFWMIWEYPHARKPLVGGWATPLKKLKVSWDPQISQVLSQIWWPQVSDHPANAIG